MQTLMVLIWCIPLGVLVVGGILNMKPMEDGELPLKHHGETDDAAND